LKKIWESVICVNKISKIRKLKVKAMNTCFKISTKAMKYYCFKTEDL
jgi:hypothetical protein